MNKWANINL